MSEEDRLQFEDGPTASQLVPREIGDAKVASSTFRSLPTNTMSSMSAAEHQTGGGGALQQLSDLLGQTMKLDTFADLKGNLPAIPINDLRGEEASIYTRDDCVLRRKLASLYRLVDIRGWTHSIYNHISARSSMNPRHFLINPFGLLYHEIRASSLIKIDDEGNVVEQGSTSLGVNKAGWTLHSALHSARSDVNCIVHVHLPDVIAVSCLRAGLLPVSSEASELIVTSGVRYHDYRGLVVEESERAAIQTDLGPHAKVLFLRNHGVAVAAASVPEAWYLIRRVVVACQTQMRMLQLAGGAALLAELRQTADRLAELHDQRHGEEAKPAMTNGKEENGEQQGGHAAVEDEEELEGGAAAAAAMMVVNGKPAGSSETSGSQAEQPNWSPEELEFEAEMRVLDSAGFRTGHVYRQPNLLRRGNGAAALGAGGWAGDTLATTGADLGTTDHFSGTECFNSPAGTMMTMPDDVVSAAEAAGAQQVARIADHVKASRQRGAQRSQWLGRSNEVANEPSHQLSPHSNATSTGAGCLPQRAPPPGFPQVSESPINKAATATAAVPVVPSGLTRVVNGQAEETATPVKRASPLWQSQREPAGTAAKVNGQQRDDSRTAGFHMKMPANKSATLPPSGSLLQQQGSPSKVYTTNTLSPDARPPLSGDEDEKQKPEKKVKKLGSFRMPSFSRKKK